MPITYQFTVVTHLCFKLKDGSSKQIFTDMQKKKGKKNIYVMYIYIYMNPVSRENSSLSYVFKSHRNY